MSSDDPNRDYELSEFLFTFPAWLAVAEPVTRIDPESNERKIVECGPDAMCFTMNGEGASAEKCLPVFTDDHNAECYIASLNAKFGWREGMVVPVPFRKPNNLVSLLKYLEENSDYRAIILDPIKGDGKCVTLTMTIPKAIECLSRPLPPDRS